MPSASTGGVSSWKTFTFLAFYVIVDVAKNRANDTCVKGTAVLPQSLPVTVACVSLVLSICTSFFKGGMDQVRHCFEVSLWLQNLPIAVFFAISQSMAVLQMVFLTAGMAKITQQVRLPMNVFLAFFVSGRMHTFRQVTAVVMLALSVALFQLNQSGADAGSPHGDQRIGIAISVLGSLGSVLGCLLSEKIMKRDVHTPFYVQKFHQETGGLLVSAVLLFALPWLGHVIDQMENTPHATHALKNSLFSYKAVFAVRKDVEGPAQKLFDYSGDRFNSLAEFSAHENREATLLQLRESADQEEFVEFGERKDLTVHIALERLAKVAESARRAALYAPYARQLKCVGATEFFDQVAFVADKLPDTWLGVYVRKSREGFKTSSIENNNIHQPALVGPSGGSGEVHGGTSLAMEGDDNKRHADHESTIELIAPASRTETNSLSPVAAEHQSLHFLGPASSTTTPSGAAGDSTSSSQHDLGTDPFCKSLSLGREACFLFAETQQRWELRFRSTNTTSQSERWSSAVVVSSEKELGARGLEHADSATPPRWQYSALVETAFQEHLFPEKQEVAQISSSTTDSAGSSSSSSPSISNSALAAGEQQKLQQGLSQLAAENRRIESSPNDKLLFRNELTQFWHRNSDRWKRKDDENFASSGERDTSHEVDAAAAKVESATASSEVDDTSILPADTRVASTSPKDKNTRIFDSTAIVVLQGATAPGLPIAPGSRDRVCSPSVCPEKDFRGYRYLFPEDKAEQWSQGVLQVYDRGFFAGWDLSVFYTLLWMVISFWQAGLLVKYLSSLWKNVGQCVCTVVLCLWEVTVVRPPEGDYSPTRIITLTIGALVVVSWVVVFGWFSEQGSAGPATGKRKRDTTDRQERVLVSVCSSDTGSSDDIHTASDGSNRRAPLLMEMEDKAGAKG
ncbi:unnamed protein product [Amoebophrya sp. A120]|nr:unnamed protein product [Amoebophrya sp. A120]|eukprot:GSA120T00010985001.1